MSDTQISSLIKGSEYLDCKITPLFTTTPPSPSHLFTILLFNLILLPRTVTFPQRKNVTSLRTTFHCKLGSGISLTLLFSEFIDPLSQDLSPSIFLFFPTHTDDTDFSVFPRSYRSSYSFPFYRPPLESFRLHSSSTST